MHCLIFIPLNHVVNYSTLLLLVNDKMTALCQQIGLPSIISNTMNKKIKLWKTVRPTRFQKQIAVYFNLLQVGTSMPSFVYMLCYLYFFLYYEQLFEQLFVFKILLFALKAIHGIAPTCIQNLISLKSQGMYNLRLSGGTLLASSTFRDKVTLGDRSFQVAAPKLWNALPRELRDIPNLHTFKSNLKTYLFKFAYGWMNFNCYISIF